MSGHVEIKPFGSAGQPPALFITVERAVVKLSQAAMAMLSREIVAHAKRKYATEIEGVYWRIDADFEAHDDLGDDVLGPTTLGYLVEESVGPHHNTGGRVPAELGEVADTNIAQGQDDPTQAGSLARQVRDAIDRRRHERSRADMQHSCTQPQEVTQ